ncbi:unnamed protein product, partial [marine sediment metagenome]
NPTPASIGEAGERADDLDVTPYSVMVRSEIKKEIGADWVVISETQYYIRSDCQKGEEVAYLTYNYSRPIGSTDPAQIETMVNLYSGGKLASDSTVDMYSLLDRTVVLGGEYTLAEIEDDGTGGTEKIMKSATYYVSTSGARGDEIADYTLNLDYNAVTDICDGNLVPVSKIIYYYDIDPAEPGVVGHEGYRAEDVGVRFIYFNNADMPMVRTVTEYNKTFFSEDPIDYVKEAETYYYIGDGRGNEMVDYVISYRID